jgi:hypothetical protein
MLQSQGIYKAHTFVCTQLYCNAVWYLGLPHNCVMCSLIYQPLTFRVLPSPPPKSPCLGLEKKWPMLTTLRGPQRAHELMY